MSFDIKSLFASKEKSSLNDNELTTGNATTKQRNWAIFTAIMLVLLALWAMVKLVTAPPQAVVAPNVEFGEIVTPDFSEKDTQSALQAQQQDVSALKSEISKLKNEKNQLESKFNIATDNLKSRFDKQMERSEATWDERLALLDETLNERVTQFTNQLPQAGAGNATLPNNPFGTNLPSGFEQGTNGDTSTMTQPQVMPPKGIQTFQYSWPSAAADSKPYRRTSKNYVPAGSFVTAVLTGAADANAGVNGQGDTAPITFRTIHNGILPNGKQSRIKDCFVTASVFGEISSNRGIARLQRMSCIFDDEEHGEEIIDIPVKGTAFNFGRNGIRGTPVMRNGDIIKMAGISGLFTGLGDTAKNASSSQITSPSGVVSTVDPSQALLNMGGSALESVGSKLSEYYIKLAEQYHPIIELNPGAVVNLVFLEGFPLDAQSIAKYEQRQDANLANTATNMMQNFSNPLAMGMAAMQQPQQAVVNNPLMNQLPPQLHMQAQQFNSIGQSQPTSPFR